MKILKSSTETDILHRNKPMFIYMNAATKYFVVQVSLLLQQVRITNRQQ